MTAVGLDMVQGRMSPTCDFKGQWNFSKEIGYYVITHLYDMAGSNSY